MTQTSLDALKRVIEVLGSQASVAAVVGVKQPTVNYFVKKPDAVVPAEWCPEIDRATAAKGQRVSCHDLRPDLWPQDFDPADLPTKSAA